MSWQHIHQGSPWDNAALNDAVRELWPTMTALALATDLSTRFGVAVTRSAVIGKANRLGLSKARLKKHDRPRPKRLPPTVPAPKPTFVRPSDIHRTFGEVCSIVQVKGCRWCVVNDKPFFFCNGPRLNGTSYCKTHEALSRRQP